MNSNNSKNDNKKVADYFAIVGLNKKNLELHPDISLDAQKTNFNRDPLVDLIIINKSINEVCPLGYECVLKTVNGFSANLHGNSKTSELYLCFKRGHDQPPITDIG